MNKLWVCKAPVISTSHMSSLTYHRMKKDVQMNRRAGAAYENGVWLWVEQDPETTYPEELEPIFKWAREHGYDYVRFDTAGNVVAELRKYGW